MIVLHCCQTTVLWVYGMALEPVRKRLSKHLQRQGRYTCIAGHVLVVSLSWAVCMP